MLWRSGSITKTEFEALPPHANVTTPDTSNPSSSVNTVMNAIADALGLGKLPSSVLYVVVGLVSGATTSVSFIRLPKQFSHQVLVFSLLVARAPSLWVGVGFPRLSHGCMPSVHMAPMNSCCL